jgi:hypothetical protein
VRKHIQMEAALILLSESIHKVGKVVPGITRRCTI